MLSLNRPEVVILAIAIGATAWLVVNARRRRAPAALVAVGAIDLLCGLLIVGPIALHLWTIVGRAVSGSGSEGGGFTYDFRFYSLVLVGLVILFPALVCVLRARRLTEGDLDSWKRVLRASGILLLVNAPLGPIQPFAIGFTVLASLNLVSLWAGHGQFRLLRR